MARLFGFVGLVVIVVALAAFGRPGASPEVAYAISCENFVLQAAAQAYLKAVEEDPDQLDGPNDNGIACEELPCPCDEQAVAELIGDAPTPTPTATATNTPSPTQASSGSSSQTTATATTPAGNAVAAATATSIAVTATTAALAGSAPATVVPVTSQGVITPPSTGDAGLR